MFSFNNPFGACPKCDGLGTFKEIDPELIIPDRRLSINQGAIKASGWNVAEGGSIAKMYMEALANEYNFSLDMPIEMLSDEAVDVILYGTNGRKLKMKRITSYGTGTYMNDFEGVINNLKRRYKETTSESARLELESVMRDCKCSECKGARLKAESLSVTVGGLNIYEFTQMSISEELEFINNLKLTEKEQLIGNLVIREINERLTFLNSVGLDYLSLSREAGTLSGGEAQRIRLATQIGSSLMGVLYILDEPSIGLHQRDNEKLLSTLRHLRDLGNTLIVVEHDEDTMRAADYLVDIGPGAGVHGGELIAAGTPEEVMACERSITGQYLSGKRSIPVPQKRREGNGKKLTIVGAQENNLKKITVEIPLGKFVAVTGVSGSGKSSLVNEILYKHLANRLNHARKQTGKFESIKGVSVLDKVINIDQSPIGKTPRSNPATYTGVFNDIRDLYASTSDAKKKGFKANRFSFNVKGGRCEACQGDGIVKIEMHFLADVYVPCEVCGGRRYNRETLDVKFKGKSIYDVLEMTVDEAVEFFQTHPKIARKLKTLSEVGLGYIKLGQPANTLSGGEAQRVKLATELARRSTGRTIYILDEPTTGLHTADVAQLLRVLNTLVDAGNTVVVIELNLDVIKTADHIIDLGPEGGKGGGKIVAQGIPEEVAKVRKSYTGQYLKKLL
jgi:excinuclease ABC subunit A